MNPTKKIAKMSDSPMLTDDQRAQFDAKVETYRQGAQRLHDAYWLEQKFTHNPGSTATVEDGGRYVRVYMVERSWVERSDHSKGEKPLTENSRKQIHTFIDKLTGDILKPATWKAPAKHARGNLFDAHNGLATVNHYGPGYLR